MENQRITTSTNHNETTIIKMCQQLDYLADTLNPEILSDPTSCCQLREILNDISCRILRACKDGAVAVNTTTTE